MGQSTQFTRLLTCRLCLLSSRNCWWTCRNSPVWPANHCVRARSCMLAPCLCPCPTVQVLWKPGDEWMDVGERACVNTCGHTSTRRAAKHMAPKSSKGGGRGGVMFPDCLLLALEGQDRNRGNGDEHSAQKNDRYLLSTYFATDMVLSSSTAEAHLW